MYRWKRPLGRTISPPSFRFWCDPNWNRFEYERSNRWIVGSRKPSTSRANCRTNSLSFSPDWTTSEKSETYCTCSSKCLFQCYQRGRGEDDLAGRWANHSQMEFCGSTTWWRKWFPVSGFRSCVSSGCDDWPHSKLERDQREVARTIVTTPNNVFPTAIGVTIDELPDAFDTKQKSSADISIKII